MDSLRGSSRFEIENNILKGEERNIDVGDTDVGKKILEILKNNPDFVGQVDAVTGEECTFQKMADQSVRCALWLRKQGMKFGDTVCLFSHNHLDAYIPCLATLFNRGLLCPSFSGYSVGNLKYILELIKPNFVFADEREANLIKEMLKEDNMEIKIITFAKIPGFSCLREILLEQELSQVSQFSCTKPKSPEDSCLLIFTSGTSGEPKPTLHLYKSVMRIIMLSITIKCNEKNIALNSTPLGWVTGIVNMILDIVTFSKKIIIHEKGHKAEEVLDFIQKYKVKNLFLGLEMVYKMYMLKNWKDYDLSSVKRMTFSGTKISPKIMNFLREILPNGELQTGYGSTELLFVAFKTFVRDETFDSCGYIMPSTQVKVINPQNGQVLKPNERGEICFKSPFIMKEYYNNPKATKAVMDEEGWYHSGDLGYFDKSGYGYIVGRKTNLSLITEKNQIQWDIERILLLNSSIVEVATISRLDEKNPRIFAFVTIVPASKITETELENIVKFLGTKELEVTIKILESMPVTFSGKIKLAVLKKMTESM